MGGRKAPTFELCADDFGGFGGPKHAFCFGLDAGHLLQHVVALRASDQRPHAHSVDLRIADRGFGQLRDQGFLNGIHGMGWDKNASDGSALLATLHGHFFAHLFDEQVKFRGAWHRIGAKNGRIQGVGLHVEWHGVFGDSRVGLQHFARGRGPREGHHVPLIHESPRCFWPTHKQAGSAPGGRMPLS